MRALWTRRTGISFRSLRPCGTNSSLNTLRALRTQVTIISFFSLVTLCRPFKPFQSITHYNSGPVIICDIGDIKSFTAYSGCYAKVDIFDNELTSPTRARIWKIYNRIS